MDLLMQNSPWNLILFMAIPVILAETIAITELFLLKSPNAHPTLSKVNRTAGILAGLAFIGIIVYFIPNVIIPLASAGEFRTWIDVVAIFSYILAGIPMILLALLNLKLLFRKVVEQKRTTYAILLLAAFLVLSHIAMIRLQAQGEGSFRGSTPCTPHGFNARRSPPSPLSIQFLE